MQAWPRRTGHCLGALDDGQGVVIVSDAERAELLNDYFSSACTTDNGAMPTVERLVGYLQAST